jgi:hypothetical protein
MDSADLAFFFWSGILLHTGLTGSMAAYFQRRVKLKKTTETRAKTFYSLLCPCMGVLCIMLIFSIIDFFHIPTGHGGMIFGTLFFHMILMIVLIVIGRIIIGWEPMKW